MTEKHVSLIRFAHFSATHHYGRAEWPEGRNREVFGKQVVPHDHDYRVEVVVSGPVDPLTGFVVDLRALDAVIREEVVVPLNGSDLNQAIPSCRDAGAQPSSEVLARHLWERLATRVPGSARLERLRVFESEELGAELRESR